MIRPLIMPSLIKTRMIRPLHSLGKFQLAIPNGSSRRLLSFSIINLARSFQQRQAMFDGDSALAGFDQTQVKLMKEECILVDNNDVAIGSASKKTCHLQDNIDKGMLHRAFSVFLFNSQGKLLLQQRSDAKITFPGHFTNTCCSHPLSVEGETEEDEAVGVRRAAQRKLHHELGINPNQVPVDEFHYLTRIHYCARNVPEDQWGEHEIDYILFLQRDVTVRPNANEVKSYRYVSKQELKHLFENAEDNNMLLTPWFRLICSKFLYAWWDKLSTIDSQKDHRTIHHML